MNKNTATNRFRFIKTTLKQKLLLTTLLILGIAASIISDEVTQIGDPKTDNYPEITFQVNVYNPEVKKKDAFKIKEEGKELAYEWKHIPPVKGEDAKKTVFILWEDASNTKHPGQKKFYQKLLTETLEQFVNAGDQCNIGVFDRSRRGESPIHDTLLLNFTDDTRLLKDKVNGYNSKNDLWFNQKSTDLFYAMDDALKLLQNFDTKNQKILLVLSAGKNNMASGKTSTDGLLALSKELKIPIYSVQYYMQGWEHNKISDLITGSYGKEIITRNQKEAQDALIDFMNNAVQRAKGQNYEFTFETSAPNDGKAHIVHLLVDNVQYEIGFNAPAAGIMDRITGNPLITAIVIIALIIIIILVIVLVNKKKKQQQELARKQQEEIEESKRAAQELKQKQERLEQESKLNEQERQRQMEAERQRQQAVLQQQEQKRKQEQQQKQQQEREKQRSEEQMRFPLPRLVYQKDGNNESYEIKSVTTTIGRESGNTFVIQTDNTVSRQHAEIQYQGNGSYQLRDFNSSNGTKVNGNQIRETVLKNGDHIQFGNYAVMFYQ